ncbi:uncharacterized protein [Nothobranchius furzeri]|uniref:uncharacterized protein n=1 Tax=Nothobranchius furzeri TaxID=105023 RepID=UPI003904B5FF
MPVSRSLREKSSGARKGDFISCCLKLLSPPAEFSVMKQTHPSYVTLHCIISQPRPQDKKHHLLTKVSVMCQPVLYNQRNVTRLGADSASLHMCMLLSLLPSPMIARLFYPSVRSRSPKMHRGRTVLFVYLSGALARSQTTVPSCTPPATFVQSRENVRGKEVKEQESRERVRSSVIREGLEVDPQLLHIERSQLRWLGHLVRMPPGRLPGEVFRAHPTGRRPKGRPRTRWRNYASHLARERLGIPSEELAQVAGEREI